MKKLLYIFLLFFSFQSFGQKPIFKEIELPTTLQINDACQDTFGFIWFASQEGLFFYNGFEIENIISDKAFKTLTYYDERILATADSVIYSINIRNKRIRKSDSKINTSNISDIAVLKDGTIFISTKGDGIFIINNSETLNKNDELPSNYIYDLEEIDDSRIAFASDRGLFIYNHDTDDINTIDNTPDLLITNLDQANELLWCSTFDSGIFSYHLKTGNIEFYPLKEKNAIKDILFKNNRVFICLENELLVLNSLGHIQSAYKSQSIQFFSKLLIDFENNLWLWGKGEYMLKTSLYFEILPLENIRDIQCISKFQNQLILGSQRGLFRINQIENEIYPILSNNITSLKPLDSKLIVGTYTDGLIVLDKNFKTIDHINKNDGLLDNSILDIELDNKGDLLVSTLSGIASIDLNKSKIHNSNIYNEAKGSGYVLNIFNSGTDGIWLGMDRTGLLKIDDSDYVSYSNIDSTSRVGSVYSIIQDAKNTVWIASSESGLLYYSSDSLNQFKSIQSEGEAYTSIIPINDNNILLVRASSIDLLELNKGHVMYFDTELNLDSKEAFLNNYFAEEGKVWFVHNDNVYIFHDILENQKIHPLTSIDAVEVNLNTIEFGKSEFEENENNFKFYFTGNWMTDPSKLSYAFQLLNYDEELRYTLDRQVNYSKLPPGDYTFKVKSAENKLFSDEPYSYYYFTINRFIYNQLWFRLLMLLITIAFIFWLIRRREIQKKMKLELEQKEIESKLINLKSQLNPHFLFNSFNTLTGLIEESPPRSVNFVHNLSDFYREILEHGDKKLISLSEEIRMVELYINLMSERFEDGFKFKHNIKDSNLLIPPMAVQMVIENAFKHNQLSSKNPLILNIVLEANKLEISNTLNPKQNAPKSTGIGLKNIKDRFTLLSFDPPEINTSEQKFTISFILKDNDV